MKVQVSISINKDVYDKAHALGINVSKASENYLRILIEAIENKHQKTVAGPMGFEPMTFSLEGGTAEDWNSFRAWLTEKKYRGTYTTTLFNYAQQYSESLFKRDLSKVRDLQDSMRPNVLKALSALAKFTGCYEDWKSLVKSYGLVWGGRSADDIFIDRLSKIEDPEEIWQWVKNVKVVRRELSELLDLMAVSGLRLVEAVNCYNLIISLSQEDKLDSYYANGALEHWRFKETFIRNSKKAFVSFVPQDLIEAISKREELSSAGAVSKLIQKRGLPLRFGDIREAHGTFMTKYLKESEINFLHGRVTASIFMANYFNPALIADLKARTFQGINEILPKIKGGEKTENQ